MRVLRAGLLFAIAMSAATSASGTGGGSGQIITEVNPLASTVTYSVNSSPPLESYVAYTVNFKNVGTIVNDVRFTFAASATDPAETVELFNPSVYLPPNCEQTGVSSFKCTKSELKSGKSFFDEPLVVFFRAPVKVVNGQADAPGTDFVHVGGEITCGHGSHGRDGSNSGGGGSGCDSVKWSGPTVGLTAPNPDSVSTVIPQSGGQIFTGENALTSPADPFAVLVTVPPASTFSPAELVETDVSTNINCTSLRNFHRCFGVNVTIPDIAFEPSSGSFMTFVLRVDASNIKHHTKIHEVLIQYTDGGNTYNVGKCASPTTPRADGIPCIAKAVQYRRWVPGWTPELRRDFEFTLINLKNGVFELF